VIPRDGGLGNVASRKKKPVFAGVLRLKIGSIFNVHSSCKRKTSRIQGFPLGDQGLQNSLFAGIYYKTPGNQGFCNPLRFSDPAAAMATVGKAR
jgi:hypothetical protein